ncbi:hypothetical protein L1987_62314 [Smallanthus sonchifolius]|uniref:Uncharacterized protein n=1 Tax=Smallanthus sonchifolius TaxID=185202 RepID=A0ACB9CA16_9ASTR|nr:hypothetical protein L1987_62314 [Smallanthus sonchifolius]
MTTATNPSTSPTKTPKKTNLLDHHSIKHLLDETVTELIIYTKEKNAFLFTYPPAPETSFSTTVVPVRSFLCFFFCISTNSRCADLIGSDHSTRSLFSPTERSFYPSIDSI